MIQKKENIAAILLFIFYFVGTIGFALNIQQDLFLFLTPFQLILTFLLLTYGNQDFSRKYFISFLIVFLIGFGVEVAGVHSGILFGEYSYGKTLGLKVFSVPLTIGLNWFILSFSSMVISRRIIKNSWLQIIIAAALMVGLDFLIEPVAIQLDFWSWAGNHIPTQNYIMWFITALAIQFILQKQIKNYRSRISFVVFSLQILFFLILNITLF